ncbi:MAG: hypothetical protein HY290_10470 [Planctomycetia bacterium]|nr:hypothetical protein [Planctomycetia bacterium]
MKRSILLVAMTAACQMAWSTPKAQAHGWRWRSGCGSYSSGSYCSGYSYCTPQSYYPTYNNCSPYYSNFCSNYGSYYGNGYVPYSNYDPSPYGAYPSSYGAYPHYNNIGPGFGGFGGSGLPGLLGANNFAGANLIGSLVQPSYLSMPVGVGYGQPGYLQIPVGSPAGRASYLQIPVNSGYGPPSYLQIELGRNPGNSVPDATPGPTPRPVGATPGGGLPTASRSIYEIHRTRSAELPPVAPGPDGGPVVEFAVAENAATLRTLPAVADKRAPGHASSGTAKIQLVSRNISPVATDVSHQASAVRLAKDTSFSLVDPDEEDLILTESDREKPLVLEAAIRVDRAGTPWVAK